MGKKPTKERDYIRFCARRRYNVHPPPLNPLKNVCQSCTKTQYRVHHMGGTIVRPPTYTPNPSPVAPGDNNYDNDVVDEGYDTREITKATQRVAGSAVPRPNSYRSTCRWGVQSTAQSGESPSRWVHVAVVSEESEYGTEKGIRYRGYCWWRICTGDWRRYRFGSAAPSRTTWPSSAAGTRSDLRRLQ